MMRTGGGDSRVPGTVGRKRSKAIPGLHGSSAARLRAASDSGYPCGRPSGRTQDDTDRFLTSRAKIWIIPAFCVRML